MSMMTNKLQDLHIEVVKQLEKIAEQEGDEKEDSVVPTTTQRRRIKMLWNPNPPSQKT